MDFSVHGVVHWEDDVKTQNNHFDLPLLLSLFKGALILFCMEDVHTGKK